MDTLIQPVGFLDRIGTTAADALRAVGRRSVLRRGESLFLQGDPVWSVGIMMRGHLKLSTIGTEGRIELVRLWSPGEIVGLVGARQGVHIGTATATDEAEVMVIPTGAFDDVLCRHPEAYPAVIDEMAGWIRHAVASQCDQGIECIAVRLARLLVSLCTTDQSGGLTMDIRLTQQELAQAIGTSRESAARVLRSWREEGLVTTYRRNLEIHDLAALRAKAHQEPSRR